MPEGRVEGLFEEQKEGLMEGWGGELLEGGRE